MATTLDRTITATAPSSRGWHDLTVGAGEPLVRRFLRTDSSQADAGGRADPLLAFAHLSDLHVCDHQSPARVEFCDRYADPDSPYRGQVDSLGAYRPQELMTTHVLDAAVRSVNALATGAPVTGMPLGFAIATGDLVDNAQANEVAWYLALLDGGSVTPDSGDRRRYEGVADFARYDVRYWHPEGSPDGFAEDLPRSLYGYPVVPGLLDAVRSPFAAAGLVVPWLAVYGNHDAHLQGMARSTRVVRALATLGTKLIEIPAGLDPAAISKGDSHIDLGKILALLRSKRRRVARDAERRLLSRPEFVAAHFASQGKPQGHGFSVTNKEQGTAYYRYDSGLTSVLVLDTVNEHGGYDGSLDRSQLRWLMAELAAAQSERRYVVVASHHTLDTLTNGQAPAKSASHRVLGPEILRMLQSYSCVVLWVNGHTHTCTVRPHDTLWEITSPSLVDWPQQGRSIELVRNGNGTLSTYSVLVDHDGEPAWSGATDSPGALASLSRTLSANDWQVRANTPAESARRGTVLDRNVELVLPDPFAS